MSRLQPVSISCTRPFVLLRTFDYRHCQPNHDSALCVLRGLLRAQVSLFAATDISFPERLLLLFFPVLFCQHWLLWESLGSFRSFIASQKTNKQTKKISSTLSAVKEKEDVHPDVESHEMNDDTFCEYR